MTEQPLNEAELEELHTFLNAESMPESTMSIEALDGFFCALAVGPELVMPDDWLPVIWGGDQTGFFENLEQGRRILELIMRHWNAVNRAVRVYPEEDALFYMPLLFPPEDETPHSDMETGYGEEWARGFLQGIRLQEGAWDDALQDQIVHDCLSGIVLLDLGENPDDEKVVVDFGLRQTVAGQLPFIAHELWSYWESSGYNTLPPQPYIAGTRIGRNDPCPCGSGKKYKKCCLH